jgi:pilus assembly protein Flp/PilA
MTFLHDILLRLAVREREEGATMVEYGLMVALIAVVALAAVTTLGGNVPEHRQRHRRRWRRPLGPGPGQLFDQTSVSPFCYGRGSRVLAVGRLNFGWPAPIVSAESTADRTRGGAS